MNTSQFPTAWQRKVIWSSLTALALVSIGGIAVGLIWLLSRVLGFLQPILIPFAIAGVMAYLLHPAVCKIVSLGTSRQRAVLFVFALVLISFVGILLWVVPAISEQSVNLARRVPGYTHRLTELAVVLAEDVRVKYGVRILPQLQPSSDSVSPGAPPADPTIKVMDPDTADPVARIPRLGPGPTALPPVTGSDPEQINDLQALITGDWLKTTLPTVLRNTWNLVRSSVGGFLGVFGFLLSMIIVPIYLYYFLIESRNISESWGDYIPLRASAFKDEVVSALAEINGYLIAFFRGQLLVSMMNGVATGILLVIVGLDFGLLVGLLLCLLGLIPYLGILLCWIPAVIIATVQGGAGTWIPTDSWWLFPLVVTGIFAIVQQIDGLFITPRIVGESVGLHPMTVIVSVFVWSLLMGGLLGAILAVPMTATVKVLLKRYVWERRFMAEPRIVPLGGLAIVSDVAVPDHLSDR